MTMRKLPVGGVWTPLPIHPTTNSFVMGYLSLVQGNITKVMFTFTVPVSGTLDMFEFQWDKTGANSATTIKVSFQDLDSNDLPDGTADQYRVITVGSFSSWVAPGLMTSDGTDSGTKRTVTRGQKLAAVIEFVTPNTGDVIAIGSLELLEDTFRRGIAGAGKYQGGAWTKQNALGSAALRYEDTVYHSMFEFIPADSLTASAFSSGTSPNEIGLQFSFQAPVRIGGASFCILPLSSSVPFDVVVYDENGNVLETVSTKAYTALAPNDSYSYWTVKFSQDIFVPANVGYRVAIKPTSANNISMMILYMPNATVAHNVYGYLDTGANQHRWLYIERTGGIDFEESETIIPLISLNVTGSDMDAGGATDDWTGDT